MTRIFLFTLFFGGQTALGQVADPITKVIFRYDKGHYTFGSSGRYTTVELIEYSNLNKTSFQITNWVQLTKTYDSATNSIKTDTTRPRFTRSTISNSKAEKLFTELNISRDNFNADFVKPYLQEPTKKEIISVANKYNLKWMFENDYSDRVDRNKLFKSIKQYSQLDTFLQREKPNLEYDLVVTDVWNRLSITCFNGADTIEYRSEFFELLGQPVKRYDNKKYSDGKKYVNLEINNSIKEFVPANSTIGKAVDLNQLKEGYIRWFIATKAW